MWGQATGFPHIYIPILVNPLFPPQIPRRGMFILYRYYYPVDMNLLPILRTGKLFVILSPGAACQESMSLIAQLALRGPVTILDGGNRYKPNKVAVLLGRKILNVTEPAKRLFSRRAFTCHEMKTLLWTTPSLHQPYIILDLLNTFQDDHVPIHEAIRLLDSCMTQIQRLQCLAPVVVTLSPPLVEERAFLIDTVCDKADQVFTFEEVELEATQPGLF